MAKPKPARSRVFLPIPADWDRMTDGEKHAASLAMAEALQRQLGVTKGKVDPRKAEDGQPKPED